MTGLEIVLALAGLVMFVLVIVGMVLIVPSGAVEERGKAIDPVPPAARTET